MKKNNVTIDELAVMINGGFEKTATKEQLENLDTRVEKLEKKVDKIDMKLDRVEKSILDDYKERLEKVEMEVKDLKDLLAFK